VKKAWCAGILSLLSSCTPKTSFVDYPVAIEEARAVYTKDSDDNCYMRIPRPEGKVSYISDPGCKATAESITITSPDGNLFLWQRDDLDQKSQQNLDFLLQTAVEQINKNTISQENKLKIRGYNELPF